MDSYLLHDAYANLNKLEAYLVPAHQMGMFMRAIRATKRVAKLIASGIRNEWEDLSAAAEYFFKKATTKIQDLLAVIDWEALLQQIKNYIKDLAMTTWNWARDHPYQAGFIVLSILTIIFAPIVVSPVLAAAGFTAIGPAVGTTAAAVQSVISPVVASSTFAILQSAAMGGYGVPIVVGSMQMIATAGLVIVALWDFFFGGRNGDVDNKDKDA